MQLELEFEGYESEIAKTGTEAMENFENGNWDLILLDVMLPNISGLEVLRRIRLKNAVIPIILLTARDSVVDKVSGLDQGASDYITKAFSNRRIISENSCLFKNFKCSKKRGK